MASLFRTGYPHPVNGMAAVMLILLPLLSPYTVAGADGIHWGVGHGLAVLLSLLYLVIWSRLRVLSPRRCAGFCFFYVLIQTALVSLIYTLDGGLTRFLFALVLTQVVYLYPARFWVPFLASLAALWLTLYLLIVPAAPAGSRLTTIGMYLLYLLFAGFVTFTTVQQERQREVAQQLLSDVNRRHETLRAYDQSMAHQAETRERERLARTIAATLMVRLTALQDHLKRLQSGPLPLNARTARAARLEAKEVLEAVRSAVRALRPGDDWEPDDEEPLQSSPEPEINIRWTDPVRLYHIWNIGVIVITAGVMVASLLVAGRPRWGLLLLFAAGLLAAYGWTCLSRRPWGQALSLTVQAGVIIGMTAISRDPLTNHLFLIVAAQMVFMAPPETSWLAAAVLLPSALSMVALWLTGLYAGSLSLLFTLTLAFAVTNFFAAVMAFMTRRQVEARDRAVAYARQLSDVNRLLGARLQEVRRMAIARERVRMAREIHDGLGHYLTVVIMELQYAEALAEEDPAAAREHVGAARQVIAQALAVRQEMTAALDRFDRNLTTAIRELVEAWRQGSGAEVRLRFNGDFSVLSTAARITLFRAVQEGLTNIQKHARATWVEISLVKLPDRVRLTVTNDDAGKPPDSSPEVGGFGLLGLRERAEALGGEMTAGPRPGSGFQLKLVLPLGV